jgi:hypothetical protein
MVGEPVTGCVVVNQDSGLVTQSPNCAPPALCGGTLAGPSMPVAFCTLDCRSAACPSGTVCETQVVHSHCLKKCSSDTDCTSPFQCVSKVGTAQNVCWSPFSGADGTFEAGTSD